MPARSHLRVMLLLLAALLALPAAALTLADTTWAEMLQMADAVVAARVVSVQAEPTAEPGAHGICTRVRLEDLRILDGRTEARAIDLLLPGGTIGNRRVQVPGTPDFVPGESAILFLRRADEPGAFHLCGYGMGVLRVKPDGRVVPDVAVENGPAAPGEGMSDFLKRFPHAAEFSTPLAGVTAAAAPHGAERSGLLFAAAILAVLIVAGLAMHKRMRTALAVLVAGVLLCGAFPPPRAAASGASRAGFSYTLEGQKWDLNAPQIDRISGGRILWFQGKTTKNLDEATAFGVIAASFQQWEDVPNSAVAFRMAGRSSIAGSADDQRNVISFLAKPPRSGFDTRTLALTYLLGDPNRDTFTDTDTVFNDRDIDWVVSGQRYSLDVVSLHEIGHIIGLGHSSSTADAMYPVAQGVALLSDSDKAGAAVLYPLNTVLPITSAYACPRVGAAPLTVTFSSEGTTAGTNVPLAVQWNFGDGTPVTSEANPVHTFTAPGTYTVTLTIPSVPLAPPSLTLIRVDAPTGNPTVKSFQYQVSLLTAAHGTDKLSATLEGVDFSATDSLTATLGGLTLASSNAAGGKFAARFNPAKHEFYFQFTGAAFGRTLDFRDPFSTVQAGTVTLPFNVLITHADKTTTLYATFVTFNFIVKSGSSAKGVVEKSIQGKKL